MKEPIGNLRNIIENKLRTWWEHKNTKSIIKKKIKKFANTNFHTIWRMYFIQSTFYRPKFTAGGPPPGPRWMNRHLQWYLHLLEWGLLVAIFNPRNVPVCRCRFNPRLPPLVQIMKATTHHPTLFGGMNGELINQTMLVFCFFNTWKADMLKHPNMSNETRVSMYGSIYQLLAW
jgi:hypothetical protein